MRLTRHRGSHETRGRRASYNSARADVRSRFGGLDLPAALAGTMAALGALALLGAIATSWFNAYDQELTRDDVVSMSGLAIGLGIVIVSSLFGGWVTGRSSRYEGAGNGLVTGLLLVLLSVGIAGLAASQSQEGTSYAIPSWITQDASSPTALTAAGVTAAVALVAAALGGVLGSFWHRRVDRALVRDVESQDFLPYPDDTRTQADERASPRTDSQGVHRLAHRLLTGSCPTVQP